MARANAFLDGRNFVTPADIKRIATDVLRHRVVPTYEAEAEGLTSDKLVARVLETVAVP
jgi:MoxR-like ATPase